MNGADLLRQFQATGSEEAFAAVVRLYANLVFSVAKRRLTEMSLAEDATQTVFTRLANSRSKLKTDSELVAWLHRTTVHVSIDLWRSETRRRTREQQAAAMHIQETQADQLWDKASPHVDEALNQLPTADREIVLLRFFQRKPMAELGRILGVSEEAAKMRVSRAIDRLRTQLEKRGIACATAALAGVLLERAVTGAPANLEALIDSIPLRNPALLPCGRWSLPSPLQMLGTAIVIVCALSLLVRLRRTADSERETQPASAQALLERTNSATRDLRAAWSARPRRTKPAQQANPRFILRVVDANTDAGLADAQIRAAYFYAAGRGEGHSIVTDRNGEAGIPEPNEGGTPGMNMFVAVQGYVPKAIGFGKTVPPEYVFKAEPAALAAGVVVDEQGFPVANAMLEASRSEDHKEDQPNTDFQTVKVQTDAGGHWQYHYIPSSYEEVAFNLTADGFAVTRVMVNMRTAMSTNATLVIKRGYAVIGRVTDRQGIPIANAEVSEFHNFGHRKLKTQADADGRFLLAGISYPDGLRAEIVVEAQQMEPQLKSIELREPTNTVDFVLKPGNVFRGHVIDESGQSIRGAAARTDSDNQGRRPFKWFTHTDDRGVFHWDAAPANPVLVWFEADGYEPIRDLLVTADGREYEIVLRRRR